MRNTFGAGDVTPAGTEFHIFVVAKRDSTAFILALCGEPCSTEVDVKTWQPNEYAAGDELSHQVDAAGKYYLWAPIMTSPIKASIALWDEIRGDRLRITYDTGCVIDAWYTTP